MKSAKGTPGSERTLSSVQRDELLGTLQARCEKHAERDRRYGKVFVYHNGAQSCYAGRAFRGSLRA